MQVGVVLGSGALVFLQLSQDFIKHGKVEGIASENYAHKAMPITKVATIA